jgi:ribosome biogenesis GTPase
MSVKQGLEKFGYSDFFETNRAAAGLADFSVGRVTAEFRGGYKVVNQNGEFVAKITGKQMFGAVSREDFPAVGDWLTIEELGEGQAVVRGILPRRTVIKRKYSNKEDIQIIAANVDVAFVVESVDRDYNLNRFDRYLAIARDGGVVPVIVLNKIDLLSAEEIRARQEELQNRFEGVEVVLTSTANEVGLEKLKNYIESGKTYCFLGSSGVGKSSLINKLIGEAVIKTENIGESTGRGKHATTSREMYFLKSGGIVIDNPGMREVGVADVAGGIEDLFDVIVALAKKCKYVDCAHTHEPGCAVLKAVRAGRVDENKYRNYVGLKKEVEFYEMTALERRRKDRNFGKMVKGAKKSLRDMEE